MTDAVEADEKDPDGSVESDVATAPSNMVVATRRATWAIAIFAVGLAVCAVMSGALAFDGSYFLFNILEKQGPFIVHARWGGVVFQLPVIAASHVTSNMAILRLIFSTSYVLPPLLAIAASWYVIRDRRPDLFIWPALGIGLITLPAAIYQVSEATMVAQLGWPLVLAVALGLHRRALIVAVVLAPWLLLLHPLGVLIVGASAGVALWFAVTQPGNRSRLLRWAAFAGTGAVVRAVVQTRFSDDPVHPFLLDIRTNDPSRMLPLAFVVAAAVGCLLLVREHRLGTRHKPTIEFVATILMGTALGALLVWANTPTSWEHELDYREFTVLFEPPLMVLMVFEAGRTLHEPRRAASLAGERSIFVLGAAVIFSVVLGVQSVRWHSLVSDLAAQVDSAPSRCVSTKGLGTPGTALDAAQPTVDWWVPALAIVSQDRDVRHVIVSGADCAALGQGRLRVTYFDQRPAQGGWFTFP